MWGVRKEDSIETSLCTVSGSISAHQACVSHLQDPAYSSSSISQQMLNQQTESHGQGDPMASKVVPWPPGCGPCCPRQLSSGTCSSGSTTSQHLESSVLPLDYMLGSTVGQYFFNCFLLLLNKLIFLSQILNTFLLI